ncbi:glycoside hydrolase family 2 [candidate division KSB1 bacterium]|nr:glycoside hydrolase family 2 [candidate division KSB1 bacterium]
MLTYKIIHSMRSILLMTLLLSMAFFLSNCTKTGKHERNIMNLENSWQIINTVDTALDGQEISSSDINLDAWIPASVPTTVLGALVENDVYQDIYYGKNLEIIDKIQFQTPWWYRTEFSLKDESTSNYRLIFEGINYRADIWLNGQKIASSDSMIGSFRIYELDVTKVIRQDKNILAVKVHPPQPGDFTIGFVDWNPRPPDSNMGLWRGVKLKKSGAISINHPFVQSKVNLNTFEEAELTITAEVHNHSTEKVTGILSGKIDRIQFQQDIELNPQEQKQIVFSPEEYPELKIDNPKLWWPIHLGEPNLYSLQLTAIVDEAVSDRQETRFGIREVSDYINAEGHRGYKVNGKPVLIRGGGWVDDLLLIEDKDKIKAQVLYTKHMNLNTIRLEGFWGSSQYLYDLADEHGLFLMPGWSCQWEWEGYLGKPVDEFGGIKEPDEIDLVAKSLRDQVLWLRNHPSIFVWVLGSDMLPRPALERTYQSYLDKVDPTRPALMACKEMTSEISGPSAVKMRGPYEYVTPNYWYVDKNYGGAFGFNTETGPGPQPPPLESIRKMIPETNLWPIDEEWNYHCGRNQFNTLDNYLDAFNQRYGKAGNVEEFAFKAQAANYEAMRAMFEAFGVNKYNATGVIQWMLNSAWPEMYWQLYDWYLMPNGAFYAARAACRPVHIAYNYGDGNIYTVNDHLNSMKDLQAEIRILDSNSKIIFTESVQLDMEANASQKIFDLPRLNNVTTVYFLDLRLKDVNGNLLSNNFYWLSTKPDVLDFEDTRWFWTPNKSFADFTELNQLPQVEIKAECNFKDKGQAIVTLANPTESLAFFIELGIIGKEDGQSILPIFWDDNYVSLLPGETRQIHARFNKEDLNGQTPDFTYQGWNIKKD